MSMKLHFLKHVVTAFVAALVFAASVSAQQSEDALLQQLQEAPESEAPRLDRELSLIWDNSGSPSMNLLLKRGRDALEEEETEKAIDHLTALTDHAPEFAEGWHARATAFYQAGLYGPALDDLERALALNPNNYNAIFGLGVMLQEFGDLERAAQAFERVLVLHPHHENANTAMEQLKRRGIGRTL
ncbi:tetratricopeptide repeat protein [uncultured Roseobacter sp.]|uniref:tetratricopeptide repeat protein n=1 Tax=uncultured Roseobacter sp. TaxID=114847 RepID=UPI00261573EC|nr:tetratricopeptide repeat protein [uncultured Roseobacter sp.]